MEDELILISVSIKKSQNEILKKHGINKSKFVRQAIEASLRKEWRYKYVED